MWSIEIRHQWHTIKIFLYSKDYNTRFPKVFQKGLLGTSKTRKAISSVKFALWDSRCLRMWEFRRDSKIMEMTEVGAIGDDTWRVTCLLNRLYQYRFLGWRKIFVFLGKREIAEQARAQLLRHSLKARGGRPSGPYVLLGSKESGAFWTVWKKIKERAIYLVKGATGI